jgi:hypothetical protein
MIVLLAACSLLVGSSAPATAAGADTLGVPRAGAIAAPGPAERLLAGARRPDRLSHASMALAIGVGAGLAIRDPATGAAVVLPLALAKELTDDRFDRGDLAAGIAGAGLAWLIVAALTR